MKKVKISTLPKDEILYIDGEIDITTVADVLEDIEYYREKNLYIAIPYTASFDAESILAYAIDDEYENGMYEDWDDKIRADITKQDIADLQAILDRILARNPSQNISYEAGQLVEVDV